jgi:Tfp pilus assembly protein PilF
MRRGLLLLAVLLIVLGAWFPIKWNFVAAVISRIDPGRPESKPIAEWMTELASDDSNAHFAAAVLLEKTFDAGDLEKALTDYEKAATLSPNNYAVWLGVAKARNMVGDTEGAESAFQRALSLAPNYASVQWSYGNFLVRQDRLDEGLKFMATAASSEPKYSGPAAAIAMQLYEGDGDRVRRVLGDSDDINASLAGVLVSQQRFDEAFASWKRLSADSRLIKFKEQTDKLLSQLAEAKRFQLASQLAGEMQPDQTRPSVGKITNGGFEQDIKLRNAGLFEWQIAEGAEPQVGRSDRQRHDGEHSLLLAFNTFETAGFRSVQQTVAVDGGGKYEFELHYRSDLKSTASLKWEVVDAGTGATLSNTSTIVPAPEWTSLKSVFTVPATTDGIIIRLSRTGCTGPSCPMNGRLWFDDLALRRL